MKREAILGFGLVVLFLFSVFPRGVHANPDASIILSPNQGFSFSAVNFTLSGFHPLGYFNIFIDTSEAGGPYKVGPGGGMLASSLDASGGKVGSIQILGVAQDKPVTLTVEAYDYGFLGTRNYANASFTLLPPHIVLSPATCVAGTTVSVTGHGFFPQNQEAMIAVLSSPPGEFIPGFQYFYLTPDSNWDINGSFNVPSTTAPGMYVIKAQDMGSMSWCTASLTVTASQTLTPNPTPTITPTPTLTSTSTPTPTVSVLPSPSVPEFNFAAIVLMTIAFSVFALALRKLTGNHERSRSGNES
jgi:hypothetical protein